MTRRYTKAPENIYRQARKEAGKWNEKFLTIRGAAEELPGISEESLKKYELDKVTPPNDVVVFMADAYNAPYLLNHYCLNECPIGKHMPISETVCDIGCVTLKLLKGLRVDELEKVKDELIDIAEDGVVSEDEKESMQEIMDYLGGVSKTISELLMVGKKILGGKYGQAK